MIVGLLRLVLRVDEWKGDRVGFGLGYRVKGGFNMYIFDSELISCVMKVNEWHSSYILS